MGSQELSFKVPATDEEVMEDLERVSRNVREVQAETLRKILERNAHVEYLQQRHGLNGRTDEACFKACVPVSTYADIADYVERIADGDDGPLLCADPITCFWLSSGTSGGKSKMIPRNAWGYAQIEKLVKISSLFRRRAIPPRKLKLKESEKPLRLSFLYAGRQFECKSGLKAGTASTIFYRSGEFSRRATESNVTSPMGVILGYSVPQQMYCHLLCGLYRSHHVELITALFAYMIVEPFRLLEQVWRDICRDIREGTVNHEHVSDPALRASVEEILSPDPEKAEFVERECEKGSWAGIVERLFPYVRFISAVFTGSMSSYIAPMQGYAGSVPLMNGDYLSSESWIGLNLHPHDPVDRLSFTILPEFTYFEFIPVHRDSTGSEFVENPAGIVGLADVEVDQEYEIVLTTGAGLYRYRLGDIVRVTGFWNSAPEVAFVCRKGVVLSVNTDKTDEDELRLVVEKASREAAVPVEVKEFTSFADVHDEQQPGHYVIFWELQQSHVNEAAIQDCCRVMDRSFNDPYMRGRVARTIGPLELRIVREGAFARLMEYVIVEKGASANQYKTPRCLVNPVLRQLLSDETIYSVRSPEFPVELSAAWRPKGIVQPKQRDSNHDK